MSKSYRKPWGTFCSIKRSAHDDKTLAARAMRRSQEQSLKEAIRDDNWDGWHMPHRYECNHNDVWGWGRDGKQRPLNPGNQYNNPYAYMSSWCHAVHDTEEKIMARWEKRKKHDDDFMADARRK